MGNANCSRCLEDCERGKEVDLKPSIIIRAFSNFRESNTGENSNKRKAIVKSEKKVPSNVSESVLTIQSAWKSFVCQKQYSLIKRLIKQNHNYFATDDLRSTLSSNRVAIKKTKTEKYTYQSGGIYKGEWLGGFRHGSGCMDWPDGAQYQGSWSFGYPFGFGKFTHIDGDSYSGEWKSPYAGANSQGSSHGKTLEEMKKSINDGFRKIYIVWLWCKQEYFSQNPPDLNTLKFSMNHEKTVKNILKKIHAQADEVNDAKIMLEETFTDAFEKMFSEADLEGGIKYRGEMMAGKRVGKGINRWENGDKYLGEWERDLQHGWGWNIWMDGSSYVGGYRDNLKDGIGEYVWEDGTRYVGGWKENNIDGVGQYLWSDGREYAGEWMNGVMHGFGMFTAKDGKKYQGKWNSGKKHGVGYTIHVDGKITLDNWEHGRIQKPNIL